MVVLLASQCRPLKRLVTIGPPFSADTVSNDYNDNEEDEYDGHSNGNPVVRLIGLAQVSCCKNKINTQSE